MKNLLSFLFCLCLAASLSGCSRQGESSANIVTSDPDLLESEKLVPSPPSESSAAPEKSRYFTDIMPPLTPEEEKMVDEPVPAEILYDFENFWCFPHVPIETELTYGQLWRYIGEDGKVEIGGHYSSYRKNPQEEIGYIFPQMLSHLKSVKMLYVEADRFADEFPFEDVTKMTWLEELYIHTMSYYELPDTIESMKSLRILSLGHNWLESLPPSLCQLENLEELYLDGNSITRLPEGIGQLKKLKVLNLDTNPLEEIPDELCELESLEILRLFSYNDSKYADPVEIDYSRMARSLPEKIGDLSKLQELQICFFPITKLPDSICNLKQMKEFRIAMPLQSLPQNFENLQYVEEKEIAILGDDMELEKGPLQAQVDAMFGNQLEEEDP